MDLSFVGEKQEASQGLRPRRPGIGGLARMAAALVLALLAQSEIGAGRSGNGLALYAIAVVLYLAGRPLSPFLPASGGAASATEGWQWLLPGLGLAVFLGAVTFALFSQAPDTFAPWRAYLLALAAVVGTVLALRPRPVPGLARTADPTPSPSPGGRGEQVRRVELWLVTAILVWAAFMRLYRLDAFPAGIFHDEAVNALDAKRVLVEHWYPTYFPDNYGRAPLYEYALATAFRVGGSNEISLRLLSAFAGVLTVAVFYRLARQFYSLPVAALAALLLASSSWHANFSRIAFDAVLAPLFLVLALFFLARALRGRPAGVPATTAGDYVLAGLWLGLGLLTYQAFRLVPLLVLAAFVLLPEGLRRWRPAVGAGQGLAGLTIVAVTATVVAVPLLHYAATHPQQFWERTRTASVLRGRPLWEARQDILGSAAAHLGMFNVAGDSNGRHNLPGAPMLHPLAGALLVLGMAATLAAWRRYPARLLLAWFTVMLGAGVMSLRFEAPHALRTLGVAPAVFLIAAAPLEQVWREWQCTFGERRWRSLLVPLGIGLAWLLLGSYQAFFVRQAGNWSVWNAFSTAETRVAQRVADLGDGWDVHIDPLLARHPVMRLLAPDFVEPDPYVATDLLPLTRSGDKGVVIFVGEQDETTRRLIQQWYPTVTVYPYANPGDGHVTLYEYRLTAEQVAAAQGLEGIVVMPNVAGEPQMGMLPQWQTQAGALPPTSLTWQGVLLVPAAGDYSFRLGPVAGDGEGLSGEARLVIDGGSVLTVPSQSEATVTLAEGRHAIWLQVIPNGSESVALIWRPPGAADWQAIERQYLYHWPIEAGGLQGDYIDGAGDEWDSPTLSRIDPWVDFYFHILPLDRPYRVRWRGWLTAPLPGTYEISLKARDRAQLWLNGTLVLETQEPDVVAKMAVTLGNPAAIEVRFWDETAYTDVSLRWLRPDGIEEPIPYTALRPPVPVVK
jgi:4-amino-4-deoxy-L-arabinose transferase-like glycosyltransferase